MLFNNETPKMSKYLELSLAMIIGLLVSCGDERSLGRQDPSGWWPMMHYGFGYGGVFMWIVFLIVIGVLIYFIVQSQKTKGQAPIQDESPMGILKKRYAKGEITREEYERIKKDLGG